jgi:hypothetical protein
VLAYPRRVSLETDQWIQIAIAVGALGLLALSVLLARPMAPYRYDFDGPDREARLELIEELEQLVPELTRNEERDRRLLDPEGDQTNTISDYFRKDHSLIVIAIQRFVLDRGHLPAGLEDLDVAGVLDRARMTYGFYRLSLVDGGWRLTLDDSDRLLARGS